MKAFNMHFLSLLIVLQADSTKCEPDDPIFQVWLLFKPTVLIKSLILL